MPAGYVQIPVGIEPQLAVRVPADLDEGLVEDLGLSGAGAGEKRELDLQRRLRGRSIVGRMIGGSRVLRLTVAAPR
ncbi:MAG: hypothetical protein AB7I33_12825 [Gemmatimonadales bacterium]